VSRADRLVDYIRLHQPRSLTGVLEARALDRGRFDACAETYLGWAEAALGPGALQRTCDAFARFSSDVNLAQARYERLGHYEHKSYAECRQAVYDHAETMTDYLWGVYLTNFLWAHHLSLMGFFEERFVARLDAARTLVEIAPGHGGWGLWALQRQAQLQLQGFDISASSIAIAGALSRAAGLASRSRYLQRDALGLADEASPQAEACICCFLVEHLEQPARLLQAIAHVLQPGGLAFFTGALSAAQVDHIHEFRRESELVLLAEAAGFRVLQTLSVAPSRQLPKARFLPRSMALLLQKRRTDFG
jgi:SAM-dependent methyltransferase